MEAERLAIIRGRISEEREKTFRKLVAEKFGFKKGSLSQGLEEAVDLWIRQNQTGKQMEKPYSRVKEELLQQFEGQIVALHNGIVIAHGGSLDELEARLISLEMTEEPVSVLRVQKTPSKQRQLGWKIQRKKSVGRS